MRKKNQRNKWRTLPGMAALLCGLAGNVQAAPVAQKPVQVPVSPDAQARIALSNTQPNLLVVPGDRIVGVDSAQGTFTNTGEYGHRNCDRRCMRCWKGVPARRWTRYAAFYQSRYPGKMAHMYRHHR